MNFQVQEKIQNLSCVFSANGNGPKWAFGFAQSDQHVRAEGRTGQGECIKENPIYKTSGAVVF